MHLLCISCASLVHLLCISRASLVHLSCITCASLVHLFCISSASLVHLLCISCASLVHLMCISRASLVHLSCIFYLLVTALRPNLQLLYRCIDRYTGDVVQGSVSSNCSLQCHSNNTYTIAPCVKTTSCLDQNVMECDYTGEYFQFQVGHVYTIVLK